MSRVPCGRICHQERMEVTLHSYTCGAFGLVVHDQISKSNLPQSKRQPLFISYMEKNSPAERYLFIPLFHFLIYIILTSFFFVQKKTKIFTS